MVEQHENTCSDRDHGPMPDVYKPGDGRAMGEAGRQAAIRVDSYILYYTRHEMLSVIPL